MKKYKLNEARVRLCEGAALYNEVPISSPKAAVDVVAREIETLDREEVVIINLDSQLHPLNYNIVSVGDINRSMLCVRNIMKSAILSNASGLIMLHNHPSGNVTPSDEDIQSTKHVNDACKLMDMTLLDHIIVGSNGRYYSFKENGGI